MNEAQELDPLGQPDLQVAALRIWVHARAHTGSEEPYDADWLIVTAHCSGSGANVLVRGAFATSSGFERFADGCDALYRTLSGKAALASDELNLTVTLEATDRTGHLLAVVEITPDHMSQEHRFEFQIDQTYLLPIARQCQVVLGRFPNPHLKQ
jgi:hypothetical protein